MKLEGYDVIKSTRKGKKYDVFDGDDYITSFGALGMEQYKDKIGLYSDYDHLDKKRLQNFNSRFKKLINKNKNNRYSAMYWSSKYLWS